MTTVRYFAAAEEAAGTASEKRTETTLGTLRLGIVADHAGLSGILPRCAVLVDGTRIDHDVALRGSETIDVLPPFAGG